MWQRIPVINRTLSKTVSLAVQRAPWLDKFHSVSSQTVTCLSQLKEMLLIKAFFPCHDLIYLYKIASCPSFLQCCQPQDVEPLRIRLTTQSFDHFCRSMLNLFNNINVFA